jgi:hypothetical protein
VDPIGQLGDVVWIRWRLDSGEHAVDLLGVAGQPVAVATTFPAHPPHPARGRVASAIARFGRKPSTGWAVRAPDGVLVRAEPTTTARLLQEIEEVEHLVLGPTELGRIGPKAGTTRSATTASGRLLTWTVTDRRHGYASAARLTDDRGQVVLEIVPDRVPEAHGLAPTDGLVKPFDAAIVLTPDVAPDVLAVAFSLVLLDIRLAEVGAPPVRGRRPGRSRSPEGLTYRRASRVEHARSRDAARDQRVHDLTGQMRAAGRDDLADRIEATREARRRKGRR